MSLEKGSTALTTFRLEDKLPDDALERFAAKRAIKFDETGPEDCIGWVSGRHLLERRIDEETAMLGGAYHLNMRITRRVIPPALLKALVKESEIEYRRTKSTDFVPVSVKKDLTKSVLEKHLKMLPPRLSGIPVAVDRAANLLHVASASARQLDTVLTLFMETFEMEPIKIDFEDIASRVWDTDEPPSRVDFMENPPEESFIPGRDFLTWLWFRSSTGDNKFKTSEGESFEAVVGGPLLLAMVDVGDGPGQGAGELTLKKGVPESSAEAKAALSVGKKLKKSQLVIKSNNANWDGQFNADLFNFTGLKLPATEKGGDEHSIFDERINSMRFLVTAMETMASAFLNSLKSPDWEKELVEIRKWASQ